MATAIPKRWVLLDVRQFSGKRFNQLNLMLRRIHFYLKIHTVEAGLILTAAALALFFAPSSTLTQILFLLAGVPMVWYLTRPKCAELALRQKAQQEQAFNRVVQTIRNSLDLEKIFSTAAQEISELLQFGEVAIVQYLPERACWKHVAVYQRIAGLPQILGTEIPDENNPLAAQLKRLETVVINDTKDLTDPINQELRTSSTDSWLLTPLGVNGQIWGSLSCRKFPNPSPYTEEEIQLVCRVADQVAIAIQQAQLYQQAQTELAERRRAEATLREQEAFLRNIYDTSQTSILVIDVLDNGDFQYVGLNAAHANLTGLTTSEIRGKTLDQVLSPQDAAHAKLHYQRCLDLGHSITYEETTSFAGVHHWWLTNLTPLYNEQAQIYRLMSSSLNITERVYAERERERQRQKIQLLSEITLEIRQSIDLEDILQTTVDEVLQWLQADRVLIYRFQSGWSGAITHEAVSSPDYSILTETIDDLCFESQYAESYQQGRISVVSDLLQADLIECYKAFLRQFSVSALLVVPLLKDQFLWGLLIVHQCSSTRNWLNEEVTFLQQLASQVSIAIQQANLYQQAQVELEERRRAELKLQQLNQDLEQRVQNRTKALQQQVEKEQLLLAITQRIRESLNLEQILQRTVDEIHQTLQAERVLVYRIFADGTGAAIAEAVLPQFLSVLEQTYPAEVFPQEIHQEYLQGRICAIGDRYQEGTLPCLRDFLREIAVQAKLVVPIIQKEAQKEAQKDQLWGLLIAHQCSAPRHWQTQEIELLQSIASQLSIAIQQADLYQQVQIELIERKQAEASLQTALQEQEVLLKEVHHRVKNNLQIISSLLGMQARRAASAEVIRLLEESQNRVQSMALIHEQLYQSPDLAQIHFGEYVQILISNLFQTYGVNEQQITLHIDTGELNLTPNTAILCGLITNELVSNSLQYAFPNGRIGEITIQSYLEPSPETSQHNWAILVIGDNGVGMTKAVDFQTIQSLGLRIVYKLVKQLKGTVTLDQSNGTCFRIAFLN
jgi:PAS domain S-box-containing protein